MRTLGKRSNAQAGAVEERIFTGHCEEGVQQFFAAEKIGDDESAPTPVEPLPLPFVDYSGSRGSSVATPTATPPTSLTFSIST